MRLIDANRLCGSMRDLPYGVRGMVLNIIENEPTVDAVKIIRCSECSKRATPDCGFQYDGNRWDYCEGYCSYAEKRN